MPETFDPSDPADVSRTGAELLLFSIVKTTRRQRHNPTLFQRVTLCRKCRVFWPCPIQRARKRYEGSDQ